MGTRRWIYPGLLALVVASTLPFSPGAQAEAACPSPSTYDSRVLADAPVAFWRLGGAGAAQDCAGAHAGTYVGRPAATTTPNGDPATAFDGVGQYVEVPDDDALSVTRTGVLTLEAWIRPDRLEFADTEGTGYVHWAGKGVSGQHEYVTRMYSRTNSENRPNRISGYAFNRSGGLGVGSYFQDAVVAGQWIHVVLVINTVARSDRYPTGYTMIYKNGVRRDQDDLSALGIVPGNGTAPVRIGTRDRNSFFAGAIGKVALYDRELSAATVSAHFAAM